jgi:hypothetical protein
LNQQLIDIEVKKNFLKNRIKLADEENFNLFIDLSDSVLTLEISGIIAHSSSILNFEIAEVLKSQKQNGAIISFLKNHFQLIDQWASIPKDPIRVKDISGYEWNPDSLNFVPTKIDTNYVFIVLKCSKELTVMISQRAVIGKMPSYIVSDHLSKFDNLMNKTAQSEKLPFSKHLQNNWVGIEIPRADAVAIFRAINDQSLLTLCL